MKKRLLVIALILLSASPGLAQHVVYDVSFPNREHHEAEIVASFIDVPMGQTLEIRMSRSSPGRYALHEFAKNVYGVHAVDGAGRELEINRPNPHQWDVSGHDGTIKVSYTLYGDRADGTYSGFNTRYAHINMPATFMWARGLEEAPIEVHFDIPEADWSVATQLYPTDDPGTFTAPDFSYFMDSPTHIGRNQWRSWEVTEDSTTYTIRLSMDHDGTAGELDQYTEGGKRIYAEEAAMWQDVPDYGPGRYTFIVTYLPYVFGDGMEHRNSTMITSSSSLADGVVARLGTFSHELFHSWNVERMRPASLEPFDFERENMSGELWFAEGVTSYYTDLIIRRAGLIDDAEYARRMSLEVDAVINDPGRRLFSAVEMSMQAPFVDAARSVDPTNRRNTFISYYTWGDAIGLGLDLTLRERFGIGLDDYMRAMWDEYGVTEIPYTLDDLERVLGEVTRDPDFADDFFNRYVRGREVVDYSALLGQAGFVLRKSNPEHSWVGVPTGSDGGPGLVLRDEPLVGSPLYEAGLARGDRILSVGGQQVTTSNDLADVFRMLTPGTVIPVSVRFVKDGVTEVRDMKVTPDPRVEVVPNERAGLEVTPQMLGFRKAWLGSKVTK